jgi:hypothetical protein
MAGEITSLGALTGANTASGDLLEIVDVSDTSMAASGTNKRITRDELRKAVAPAATPDALTGSPTLKFWYKASTIGIADGASVSSWSDSGPNGYTLTQGTGSKQPVYNASHSMFNGQAAVKFDGTDDSLNSLSNGASSMTTYSAFIVCHFNTVATSNFMLDARGSGYVDLIVDGAQALGAQWGVPTSGAASNRTDPAGTNLLVLVYDGTYGSLYLNGRPVKRVSGGGAVTPSSIYVGSNADANNYSPSAIAEVGVYSTALSAAQLQQLTNGLAAKYGLGMAVPA